MSSFSRISSNVPETWSEALQSFVEQGGGLCGGGDNTTTELNDPLGRLFQCRFEP